MTRTLVILAHPRPGSFNHAWANASAAASELAGPVVVSDLYSTGFDPRHHDGEDPRPPEIEAEIERVRQADRLVFHFPLWWFALPAILKGWFDRVLAHGVFHSSRQRFDTGPCKGKAALFCVTTGSTEVESAPDGKEGDVRMHLWPAAYTLRYCGFDVLQPITVHGVHRFLDDDEEKARLQARLAGVLDAHGAVIRHFDTHPRLVFNADTDFTSQGALRRNAPSHSPFIRHREA